MTLLFFFSHACLVPASGPRVETIAGTGIMSDADGPASSAGFANLMGIAVDRKGNLYIADSHNNKIKKISASGQVTTLAGGGQSGFVDGPGPSARFFYPTNLTLDRQGNILVSDTHNNSIRKIDSDGRVTTIAGVLPPGAVPSKGFTPVLLDNPAGLVVDSLGNLYIADWANDVIRKITPEGVLSIFAGQPLQRGSQDGPAGQSTFYLPWGLALDTAGNLLVSDSYNNKIRKISPEGMVSSLAGNLKKGAQDGVGEAAGFLHPAGIALSARGQLLVADQGNHRIRSVSSQGVVTTLAGNGQRGHVDGALMKSSFFRPYGIAVGPDGTLFVADYLNNQVRAIRF